MTRYTARDAERPLRVLRALIGKHGIRDVSLTGSVAQAGSSEKDVDILVEVPGPTRLALMGEEEDDGRGERVASAIERALRRAGCGYDRDPMILRRSMGYSYHRGMLRAEVRRRLGIGFWDADTFNTSCPRPGKKGRVPVDVFVVGD